MWWLTKAKTELKREHWTKRWNWSGRRKLVLRASCTHGRIAQSVRALVVLKSPSVVNSIYIYIYKYIYIYIYIYITILKRNDGQSKCVMTIKKNPKSNVKKKNMWKIERQVLHIKKQTYHSVYQSVKCIYVKPVISIFIKKKIHAKQFPIK